MQEVLSAPDHVLECDVEIKQVTTIEDNKAPLNLRDIENFERTKIVLFMKQTKEGLDITVTPTAYATFFTNCNPKDLIRCESSIEANDASFSSRMLLSRHSGSVLLIEKKRVGAERYHDSGTDFKVLMNTRNSKGFCRPRGFKTLF